MKILIATPVHEDRETFQRYLTSLHNLDTEGLEVDYFFIFHNCDLEDMVDCSYYKYKASTDYKVTETTHHWSSKSISHMSTMRNMIAVKAKKYDYLFMVDSDIILHRNTLKCLLSKKKDIIANIFWTWTDKGAWANAWLKDQSDVDKETLVQWQEVGTYKVGGTGACILVSTEVYNYADYSPIYNLSLVGEDRFFCTKAICAGYTVWLDTTYPAIHLYTDREKQRYDANLTHFEMMNRMMED